jgi:hypothetical protein
MFVEVMSVVVYEISVDEIFVNEMSVDKIFVDETYVVEMTRCCENEQNVYLKKFAVKIHHQSIIKHN